MQPFIALVVAFMCVSQLHADQSSTIVNSTSTVCFNVYVTKHNIPKTQFLTEIISVSLYPTNDSTEFPALDFKNSSSMARDGYLYLVGCAETEASMTDMTAHLFVKAACTQQHQNMGKGLTKSTTFTKFAYMHGVEVWESKEQVINTQILIGIDGIIKEGENTLDGIKMESLYN